MRRACIAIVDAAHARIYTYDRADDSPEVVAGAPLQEVVDLVNPGRRGHDLFSTSRAGLRNAPGGINRGATDDHRDAHFAELERRFAKQVIDEVARIAAERGLANLILVASPRMLGELRAHDAKLRGPELALEYVERDLAQLSSPQIHDHLAELQLIEPRPRAFAR